MRVHRYGKYTLSKLIVLAICLGPISWKVKNFLVKPEPIKEVIIKTQIVEVKTSEPIKKQSKRRVVKNQPSEADWQEFAKCLGWPTPYLSISLNLDPELRVPERKLCPKKP